MPEQAHAPSATRPINVVLRLVIFVALVYALDRLADDVVLPGLWPVIAFPLGIAIMLMAPGLIANAMCDLYDRVRSTQGAPPAARVHGAELGQQSTAPDHR